jgi:hypothetical protein
MKCIICCIADFLPMLSFLMVILYITGRDFVDFREEPYQDQQLWYLVEVLKPNWCTMRCHLDTESGFLASKSSRLPPSPRSFARGRAPNSSTTPRIKFPLVVKKVRPPTRKLKTTYKATRPSLFM